MKNDSEERWVPALGSEHYDVSSHGRVRSKDRLVVHSGCVKAHTVKGRDLVLTKLKTGYLYVNIGKWGSHTVHHLVMNSFTTRPDWAQNINHIDGCKTNNNLTNLEWATHAQNNRHARLMRLNRQDGVRCNLTKFSDDVVDAVRILSKSRRFTRAEIATMFSMSEGHVGEITTYRSRYLPL